MAHRTSASALHTARVILKNYDLTVRPPETLVSGRIDNLKADEAHLAIIIDYATNAFEVALLRPEVRYWQRRLMSGSATAPQIAGFMAKLLKAFALIPRNDASAPASTFALPKEFTVKQPKPVVLSKAACETSRFVFHYYEVHPHGHKADEDFDRHQIARLAEVSLGLDRAQNAVPLLAETLGSLEQGKATETDIRICLRKAGVLMQYLPTFEEREEEVKLL